MDWQIIISLVTLVLVVFTIVWGTGLWVRREKVKIKITSMDYKVDAVTPEVKVYWGGEFQRLGKKDVRYIKQILLKPDTKAYKKLCEYFKLPADGLIRINEQLKLPKYERVSPYKMGLEPPQYPVYPVVPELPRSTGQRDKSQQVADELSQKTLEVGLVWDDTDKITWKTVSEEDWGQWI